MQVINVVHLGEYKLKLKFSNNTVKVIDLKEFLLNAKNPMTKAFINIELFKQVKITHGHLTWLDGEMDLSAQSLYNW